MDNDPDIPPDGWAMPDDLAKRINESINHTPYAREDDLREAMVDFVDYHNNQRCHESLDNMTPIHVFYGKEKEVRSRRDNIKRGTMVLRRQQNLVAAGV